MEIRSALPSALLVGILFGLAGASFSTGESRLNHPLRSLLAPPVVPGGSVATPATRYVSWDIPVVWNEPVARFVTLFTEEQTGRMELYLKRSGRYEGMIRQKLQARGMPQDLVYLSMIESGFNPTARSHAKAVGLWQFIAETGRRYGLRIDRYVDERRDPARSTDAALDYLQELHDRFGSWNLAAAAYNSGENRVSRIMRKETGAERGRESDFWRIRDQLPRETREYVPLIVAAAIVGKQPEKYGMAEVERWLPAPVDEVSVPGGTELGTVAAAVGISKQEMKRLNPHLIRGMTPPGSAYPVRIPEGRAEMYGAKTASRSPAEQPVAVGDDRNTAPPASNVYRVLPGESLWTIARKHGKSVLALQDANGLGTRTRIRPGQTLRIPA
jgi:membrane-bound lytic murein transglycosylase D